MPCSGSMLFHPQMGRMTLCLPGTLLTGKHLYYQKHVHLKFGAYIQTHEEHTNDMMPCTIRAICLSPSGNEQGGHYFLSLMTGCCLLHDCWTELPMPQDAITCVGNLGHAQGMPKSLTFADHYGFKLVDDADAVDDNHDSDFDPDDASYSSTSSDDNSDPGDDFGQPLLGLPAGVTNDGDDYYDHANDDYDYDSDDHDDDNSNNGDYQENHDIDDDEDNNTESTNEDNDDDDDNSNDGANISAAKINIPDTVVSSPPVSPSESTGVGTGNTGVGEPGMNPTGNDLPADESINPASQNTNEQDELSRSMDGKYAGSRTHGIHLRDQKPR